MFYDIQPLSDTTKSICRLNTNHEIFVKYVLYVNLPLVNGLIPIIIWSVFGRIALHNVSSMRKRQVHVIRLRLEQQLTAMVLIKILSIIISLIPIVIIHLVGCLTSANNSVGIIP